MCPLLRSTITPKAHVVQSLGRRIPLLDSRASRLGLFYLRVSVFMLLHMLWRFLTRCWVVVYIALMYNGPSFYDSFAKLMAGMIAGPSVQFTKFRFVNADCPRWVVALRRRRCNCSCRIYIVLIRLIVILRGNSLPIWIMWSHTGCFVVDHVLKLLLEFLASGDILRLFFVHR